jgi:hypothetical protein
MPHLYRKSRRCVTGFLLAALLWVGSPAQAQRPELKRPQHDDTSPSQAAPAKKSRRGPRAIAVVEFLPGGAARLVPIALWMDGKYYDASLYQANPEPFALEPGTVYEAQNYGETAGTFVVNTPQQVNGSWVGEGRWKAYNSMDAKLAADAAKQPKAKQKNSSVIFTGGPDEGPPVLHRSGDAGSGSGSTQKSQQPAPADSQSSPATGSSSSSGASGSASNTQSASADSGRPTLKRPSDEPSPADSTGSSGSNTSPAASEDSNRPVLHRTPNSDGSPTSSGDDPDRPVFRKPTAPAAGNASSGAAPPGGASSDESDPNRPVLSRGKPTATAPSASLNAPALPQAKKPANANPAGKPMPGRLYAAISDAGTYESRSLLYSTTPEQKQENAQQMLTLAMTEIRAFAAKRPGPQIPKTAAITDYDLRYFDLDFSNSPTLVLTAKLPVAAASSKPFVYYATVVTRLDINGIPVKVFSSVTDSSHLDVFPRMELVDALDADNNGRGDLLFRQYSDTGISYGLYRVFPYNMEKVFEGGSSL